MFFCSTSMFLVSKKQSWKTQIFGQKGSCNKTVFFMSLWFGKCEKLSFFWPMFGQVLVDVQKHYKIGISAHFKNRKKQKKMHFEVLLSGPSRCYYLGQVDCNLKMANLAQVGPDNNTSNLRALFFSTKKRCWNPYFIVFFDKQCFVKSKLGPDNNTSKGQTWPR